AMLHDPDLLIFDEPTDGLDPMGRSQIRDVLFQLKQRGKTVFLNSHILQEVELICDRVAIMALGILRGIGTIDELIENHPDASRATVTLEVAGDSQIIEQALSVCNVRRKLFIQNGDASQIPLHRIEIDATEQSSVDQAVDRLRAASISIYRMERFRPTLEQVFMSIVGSVSPHAASPQPGPNRSPNNASQLTSVP
ncbi:MAG: ABC transporter ATP-binding protein, partial [Pirellula sp.]